MMTDSEIYGALEDLSRLTDDGLLKWVEADDSSSLTSLDLKGFTVVLRHASEVIEVEIQDSESGVVARVAQDDGRAPFERARLQGAAYGLVQLAKARAGSHAASRFSQAVQRQRGGGH